MNGSSAQRNANQAMVKSTSARRSVEEAESGSTSGAGKPPRPGHFHRKNQSLIPMSTQHLDPEIGNTGNLMTIANTITDPTNPTSLPAHRF